MSTYYSIVQQDSNKKGLAFAVHNAKNRKEAFEECDLNCPTQIVVLNKRELLALAKWTNEALQKGEMKQEFH